MTCVSTPLHNSVCTCSKVKDVTLLIILLRRGFKISIDHLNPRRNKCTGGPEVLKLETRPIPTPARGQVLIQVKAFGLNRSELFTRQGHSPGVPFPRVLGIEAVGLVESAPGNEFEKGTAVATAMGGMGRQYDGGYAEYTCVPATQVQVSRGCTAF